MRVKEIIDIAVVQTNRARKGEIPNDLWDHCLDLLNMAYLEVWNLFPWNSSKMLNVTVTTADGEVILPNYIDNIRAVRVGVCPLSPINEIILNRVDPEAFERTGTPYAFEYDSPSPVQAQPAAASTITIKSSSASDTALLVRVYGTVAGLDDHEDLTLNGVSDVTGSKSFTAIRRITKPVTVGRVSVLDSGATELGTIAPGDYQPEYQRLQLVPRPGGSTAVTIQCLRKFQRLSDNYDAVEPSEMATPVTHLLMAALYRGTGNMEMAQAEAQTARASIKGVASDENDQNDTDFSILPDGGMFGGLGNDSGHGSNGGYPHYKTS